MNSFVKLNSLIEIMRFNTEMLFPFVAADEDISELPPQLQDWAVEMRDSIAGWELEGKIPFSTVDLIVEIPFQGEEQLRILYTVYKGVLEIVKYEARRKTKKINTAAILSPGQEIPFWGSLDTETKSAAGELAEALLFYLEEPDPRLDSKENRAAAVALVSELRFKAAM